MLISKSPKKGMQQVRKLMKERKFVGPVNKELIKIPVTTNIIHWVIPDQKQLNHSHVKHFETYRRVEESHKPVKISIECIADGGNRVACTYDSRQDESIGSLSRRK